jgi:hypothetical protein
MIEAYQGLVELNPVLKCKIKIYQYLSLTSGDFKVV